MVGMANICKLLINVVRHNRLKMLTSRSQKALQRVSELPSLRPWVINAAGGQGEPKPSMSAISRTR